ncbi:MAG: hypothetical protein BGO70_18215 [Bacteroidetes bacterium 43-93]|nr:hypothetical protein [Bacteroidota bacterium]OJX01668.1 MAG: hypothetical protein BGO70_18215 [Bacteroidetes bacterium 43-93]
MIRIDYPSNAKDIKQFHAEYLSRFNIGDLTVLLNIFLQRYPHLAGLIQMSVEEILTSSIEDLWIVCDSIKQAATPGELSDLGRIFNYDKNGSCSPSYQSSIADFFRNNSYGLDLNSCFFCNIDHINSITGVGDYNTWYDFYKNATEGELQSIEGIGPISAAAIVAHRQTNMPFEQCPINKKCKTSLRLYKLKNSTSHFTLDHVLDKASYPLAALSLYNLVPSCYSCNTKFKGTNKLVRSAALTHLSPSSLVFSFTKHARFKIYFPSNNNLTYLSVQNTNDFVLSYEIDKGAESYNDLIKLFKLRSRYIFHKKEAVKLIKKRKRYSNSQIEEIAKLMKISKDEVKKDIFGDELFNRDYDNSSLVKLKRDIAQNIGIEGIR